MAFADKKPVEKLPAKYNTYSPLVIALIQGASVFIIVTICLVILALQNYKNSKREFKDNLEKLTRHAASLVDMELHQQLTSPEQLNSELYNDAIRPLVLLHNAYPEIHYLYTIIEKSGKRYFILDTSNSDLLKLKNNLVPSGVMEEYDDSEVETDWLESVRQGQVFIDKEPYGDDYGVFVSGSAPLFDSQGSYAGILGIDIDANTFFLLRNRAIIDTVITSLIALVLSVIVGFLRYRNRKYIEDIRNLEYNLIFIDTLTDTFNRRYYNELIQNEWARYKRYKTWYTIAIFDIDFFKQVNDTYGHVAGDRVLVYFVEQIKNSIRDTDALVRMGGEEFLIFMPNTDEAEAVNLTKRINNRIAINSVTVDEKTISVTFSAGLSSVHEMDESYEEIYKRADIALYHAKQSGRNKVVGSEQLPKEAFDNKQV